MSPTELKSALRRFNQKMVDKTEQSKTISGNWCPVCRETKVWWIRKKSNKGKQYIIGATTLCTLMGTFGKQNNFHRQHFVVKETITDYWREALRKQSSMVIRQQMVGNPAFAPTGLFSSLRKYVRVSNLFMFTGGQVHGGTNELP